MACHGIYTTGNRVAGHICGTAWDVPKRPCCRCREPALLLCDGPRDHRRVPEVDDEHDESQLCSVSICAACSVSLRAWDLDFCPECVALAPRGECQLADKGPSLSPLAGCRGALVAKADLCIRHAVLFDHWHAFEGGEAVYGTPALNREQRREAHRRWLRAASELRIADILLRRNAIPAPRPEPTP